MLKSTKRGAKHDNFWRPRLYVISLSSLILIGIREGTFPHLVLFGSDFVSWIFIKNLQTFLEVKIDISLVNLTPCQTHCVLWEMPLGCSKDKHFSCFHSSCQLGLSQENCTGFLSSCQRKLDKSIFLSRPPFALQYICTKLTENFINKTIFIYKFFLSSSVLICT